MKYLVVTALAIAAALLAAPAVAQVSTTISGMQCPAVYGRQHPDVCTCRYVTQAGRRVTKCVVI